MNWFRKQASDTQITHGERIWLYLIASIIMFLLIFPTIIVIPMSFSESQYLEFPPKEWSLRWYNEYWETPRWINATVTSLKIAFFTAKMNLNTEESKVFWPVVNEMENELKDLKDKNAHGRMMLKDKKIEDFSDEELEQMMDARIQMGKEKVDILVKYHEKFKEVIPIRKLAKYYQTGTEFKKIQLERKKQHNNPGERKR